MSETKPDFEISVPITVFEEDFDPETEAPDLPNFSEENLDKEELNQIREMGKLPKIANPTSKSAIKSSRSRAAAISLTDSQARYYIDIIKSKLSEGISDLQISEELDLTARKYNHLKRLMYDWEIEDLQSKTPEEHFIDYRIKQDQTIRNLDIMCQNFEESKNYNALIGAVRLKTEVMEKVWKMGREIGIIKSSPDWDKRVAGELVSQLDSKAIRSKVVTEVRKLYDKISKFGDKDILATPGAVPKTPPVAKKKIKRTKH